jgi:hypothetical protein
LTAEADELTPKLHEMTPHYLAVVACLYG